MKAYVIKNKEGEYFCGFDGLAGVNIFSNKINLAISRKPTKKRCLEEIKGYNLKDCTTVPITIAEGDLEEKYDSAVKEIEYLKKALSLQKEFAEDIIYKMNYCGGVICDEIPNNDYFVQQAKESRNE